MKDVLSGFARGHPFSVKAQGETDSTVREGREYKRWTEPM